MELQKREKMPESMKRVRGVGIEGLFVFFGGTWVRWSQNGPEKSSMKVTRTGHG